MLGEASDPGLGVSFSRGGSAGSGGLEARPAALTCANVRGMWTPPEMGMPNGRAVPRTSRGALRHSSGRTTRNSDHRGGTAADDINGHYLPASRDQVIREHTGHFHLNHTLFLEAVTERCVGGSKFCCRQQPSVPIVATSDG